MILATSIAPCAADADAPLRIVLARTGSSALLLWNATPYVSAILSSHLDEKSANDVLERGALRAVAEKFSLVRNAKTIVVRILYDKTGDVSPVYGGATFAGVERYAVVELDGVLVRDDADSWRELRARDPIPKWVSFQIVGTLPPK